MRAWGPPMALITRELVMKGPMPTISIMLRATASFRPKPRSSWGCKAVGLWGGEGFPMRWENNKRMERTGKETRSKHARELRPDLYMQSGLGRELARST